MRQVQTLLMAGWLAAGWLAAGWLVTGAVFAADGASDGLTELVARARSTVETDRPAAVALLRQAAERASTSQDWPLRRSIFTSLCWWQAPYEPALAEQFIAQQRPLLNAASEAATEAELVLCQGYVAEQLGELERAGSLYEQAVERATILADEPLLESALALRGEWRYGRGDIADALADLQQAFAISSRLGLDGRRRYVLNAIANLYADQRVAEYDKALEYFQQLRAEHQATGEKQNFGTSEFNIGATLEAKGDLAGALPHYHAALAIGRELANAADVAVTERAIGSVLVKLSRAQEAMPLLESALTHFRASNNPDAIATVLLSRGIAQHALGRSDDALRDLAAADSYFSGEDNPRYLERIRQEQAAIYREQGRYAESLAMVQQQLQLRERLAEQLKTNLTSRLRVQFDTERKEQQNQQLQRENALHEQALLAAQRIRQQQWLIIGLVVLVAVVLAYLFSKQRRQAQRMRAMAMTDELTRLPNRRHVFELLAQQLAALKPTQADYCLLMLDVDHFKQVNDRWGHEVGDKVLQRVAHCLRTVSRPGDAVGRIGGEEFLVLLPGTPLAHAQDVAERLRAAVQALNMQAVASGLQVSISIGLAALSPNDHDGAETIRRADAALYEAKASGRNRVAVALP